MVKKTEKKVAKKSVKPTVKASKKSTKVDYYPNKMTLAISAAAAVSLTLIALLATTTSL